MIGHWWPERHSWKLHGCAAALAGEAGKGIGGAKVASARSDLGELINRNQLYHEVAGSVKHTLRTSTRSR